MNPLLRKVPSLLNQAPLCRVTPLISQHMWGGVSVLNERHYNGMPTYGIGRWQHLVQAQEQRKKKDRIKMKEMTAATSTAHGTLNVEVTGYDMTLVEHYAQYIHNLCHRLNIQVSDCFALPTLSKEVYLLQDQGTKMFVDSELKTHKRVIQLGSLEATLCPTFVEVVLKNQPEGVHLSVKQHTEADFLARFKVRTELDGVMAKMKQ